MRRQWKAAYVGILIITVVGWSTYLWRGPAGVAAQHKLELQRIELEEEKEAWDRKLATLDVELNRWDREPLYMVEKVAREEYDYAAPDEVVFLLTTT